MPYMRCDWILTLSNDGNQMWILKQRKIIWKAFYTRKGKNITCCLTLFDTIKSELTIDNKMTSTYISRRITKILYWYRIHWCYHGNTGDTVDHRGRYTESSGIFKRNSLDFRVPIWTVKIRTCLQQYTKMCIQWLSVLLLIYQCT